jgi:Putative peptidoglycan binding domain
MDYFTLTFDVDADESRLRSLVESTKSDEQKFWYRFRKAERKSADPVPTDINDIHARIREKLPAQLKDGLVKKLRVLLSIPESEPYPVDPQTPADAQADTERKKRDEVRRTLETLEIHVKAIRGGSLEILLFVLGFTKLVSLTGISPDDFAKCLEIAGPVAMNVIFGTSVPLEADAKPSLEGPTSAAQSASEGAAMRLPAIQNPSGASYFIPALFGLAVFGCGMWVVATISSEFSAERKELVGYVRKEAEDIGKERTAIAEKLSTLLSTHDATLAEERKGFLEKSTALLAALTKSQVDKDNALTGSQKALFDAELGFVQRIDGANQARETAVIDFVKSHLAPDLKPTPSPSPPSKATVTSTCAQGSYLATRRIQLALSKRGLYTGEIDGRIGPKTEEGLRKFQVQASLPSTGTADSATLEKLGVPCEAASVE